MIKKKKQYHAQIILKQYNLQNNYTDLVLTKSLYRNFAINPKLRHVYSSTCYRPESKYYNSLKKLRCIITTNRRVPCRYYMLSRHYLTKFSDNLNISNLIRK